MCVLVHERLVVLVVVTFALSSTPMGSNGRCFGRTSRIEPAPGRCVLQSIGDAVADSIKINDAFLPKQTS